jgi:hypothetical protein
MPGDHAGLVAELEKEGYTLNLDEYSPPEQADGSPQGDKST